MTIPGCGPWKPWLTTVWAVVVAAVGVAMESGSAPPAVEPERPDPVAVERCWRRLVAVESPPWPHDEVAREAVARLLRTRGGGRLVADLCTVLPVGGDWPESRIQVRFVARLRGLESSVDGLFRPLTRGAESYELVVHRRRPEADEEPTVFVFGEYPSNPDCAFVYFYQEPASVMAQTLFHELLHVWFLNAEHDREPRYPTGHGDVERCEFEDAFLAPLRAHAAELTALEGRAPPPLQRVGRLGPALAP